MAQQGNPALYVDTGDNADQSRNMRRISTWSKSASPFMYSVDPSTLDGSTLPVPPIPQSAYLMWAGSPTIAFSSGTGVYVFPRAFPNGLLAATLNLVSVGPLASTLELQNAAAGTSAAELVMYATYNGSPITGSFVVSGFAVGF